MTSSLVGSEMCIRDSPGVELALWLSSIAIAPKAWAPRARSISSLTLPSVCLLYTSDAADDM
eukprot:12007109-Prorocentrum_lima.AAC.1